MPQLYVKIRRIFLEAIIALLILLWLYTATWKIIDYENGLQQMARSPMVSGFATGLVFVLPIIELVTAFLLVARKTRLIGLIASFFLMTLFTAYIIILLNYYSDSVPCVCGALISKLSWQQHIVFNVFFMLCAFTGICLHFNQELKQGDPSLESNLEIG